MLPLIWVVGLVLGIALLFIGSAADHEGVSTSGLILTISFAVCMIIWLVLYVESCVTVADLKTFAEAHNHNYKTIVEQSEKAIDWSKVSDSEWYVQDATFGEYALILSAFMDEIHDYNHELGRLRDFNQNRWLDLIFRDVPPNLEYFLLEGIFKGNE